MSVYKHLKYSRNSIYKFVCLPILYFLFIISASADEFTDRAQQLIDDGNSAEAYTLLIAELEERAGTPEYDILLGIAAMDTNRPTEAVLAFERVLAIDPDNTLARLELARAYFALGENEASREEFNNARTQEVPEDVTATIEEYLTAIDSRIRSATMQRRFNAYLQASLGYDTNVNSATDSTSVTAFIFGVPLDLDLDSSSRELDSGFYNLGGGFSFSSRVAPESNFSVFGGGSAFYRPTWEEHRFDTAAVNGRLGLRYTEGVNSVLLSLSAQKYLIDDETNRDQGGLNLQWLHMLSQRTQVSAFIQGLMQRFPDQEIRDLDQFSGGVGFVHLLPGNGNPIIFGSLYVGTDDEQENTRQDFGRTFYGIRAGGEYSINEDMKWIASASYQYSKYGADDPLFQETRKDNFFFLRGGLQHAYGENWVITSEIQYLLNDSNLIINDFDRWQFLATARYNF